MKQETKPGLCPPSPRGASVLPKIELSLEAHQKEEVDGRGKDNGDRGSKITGRGYVSTDLGTVLSWGGGYDGKISDTKATRQSDKMKSRRWGCSCWLTR